MILTTIKTKNIPKNIQISVSKGIPITDNDIQRRNTTYNNIICKKHRNEKNIISSISVTDIVFDDYLGKWNNRAIL